MSNRTEVIRYATDFHWSVFPVIPKSKQPATKHGLKDATTDTTQIETWWTSTASFNVGVVTGRASGFFVVDVDGETGLQTLRDLEAQHGATHTRKVATGGGGIHLYFKTPDIDVRNRTKLLPGIDIRGEGGYVVTPPSMHESGKRYEWLDECEIADAPAWLLDLLAPKTIERPQHVSPSANGHSAYVAKAFDAEIGAVANAPEGTRNDALNRAAFNLGTLIGAGLLDRGLTEEALLSAARANGLPERESIKTIRSGLEGGIAEPRQLLPSNGHRPDHEAPAPEMEPLDDAAGKPADDKTYLVDFPLTDRGNAECLERMYGDRLRYEYTGRKWRLWTGQKWKYDIDNETERLSVEVSRARRMAFNAQQKVDEKAWQFCLRSENQRNTRAMMESAQSLRLFATVIGQYDSNPMLASAGDVTIDLAQVTTRKPDREDYITLQLGAEYDADADSPRWRQFLHEIFEDDDSLIRYIQRAWGYSLTGSTQEQKLFLCHGTGANGKSTFLTVLSKLMGEYSGATSFDTFDAETSEARTDLAKLRACRVVTVIESDEDARLNEARVKSVTGGDKVTARELYANSFDYTPSFKLWLAMNHKPIIRGTDNGIWRRIQLIPFTQNFEGRKDLHLDAKLQRELPGILSWALDGLIMWHAEGLNPPAIVTQATEEYRRDSDVIGQWVEACCKTGATFEMGATAAYTSYKSWSELVSIRPMSMTSWGRKMVERGFEKTRNAKMIIYRGAGLLDNTYTNS